MNGIKFLIIVTLLGVIIYLIKRQRSSLKLTTSDIDGKMYWVRDLEDKKRAANMLAKIRYNINKLRNHLVKNIDDYPKMRPYIKQMDRKIRYTRFSESTPESVYTSYSVNKGEQIVFCLRSKYYKNKMHKLNLVMYVTLHELAHVACPEYGHTKLFKKIFAFLTNVAIEHNIYERIPFDENPTEYCGLTIGDSIV